MKKKSLLPVICAVLGNVIWGFSFLFTKVGLGASPDPNVMLAHRFLIAVLILVGIRQVTKPK